MVIASEPVLFETWKTRKGLEWAFSSKTLKPSIEGKQTFFDLNVHGFNVSGSQLH